MTTRSIRSTRPSFVSQSAQSEAWIFSFEQVKQCAKSAYARGGSAGMSRRAASSVPSEPGKRTESEGMAVLR
jgi:hypothetical protein